MADSTDSAGPNEGLARLPEQQDIEGCLVGESDPRELGRESLDMVVAASRTALTIFQQPEGALDQRSLEAGSSTTIDEDLARAHQVIVNYENAMLSARNNLSLFLASQEKVFQLLARSRRFVDLFDEIEQFKARLIGIREQKKIYQGQMEDLHFELVRKVELVLKISPYYGRSIRRYLKRYQKSLLEYTSKAAFIDGRLDAVLREYTSLLESRPEAREAVRCRYDDIFDEVMDDYPNINSYLAR